MTQEHRLVVGKRYKALTPAHSFENEYGEMIEFDSCTIEIEIMPTPEHVLVDDGVSQSIEVTPEHLKTPNWYVVTNINSGKVHWFNSDNSQITPIE